MGTGAATFVDGFIKPVFSPKTAGLWLDSFPGNAATGAVGGSVVVSDFDVMAATVLLCADSFHMTGIGAGTVAGSKVATVGGRKVAKAVVVSLVTFEALKLWLVDILPGIAVTCEGKSGGCIGVTDDTEIVVSLRDRSTDF